MGASAQHSLFEAPRPATPVAGLTYLSDAVSSAAEAALRRFVETLGFKPFAFRGFDANRRTVSFGWRYDFNGGGFQRAQPLPAELEQIRARVAERLGVSAQAFEQCSVIEYKPGAGIGWHRDRPQFGKGAGLSLLAPCRFRFRRADETDGWERASLQLEPRSIYLMEGDVRNVWQHSIPPLDRLRHSVTFRTFSPLGESLVNR